MTAGLETATFYILLILYFTNEADDESVGHSCHKAPVDSETRLVADLVSCGHCTRPRYEYKLIRCPAIGSRSHQSRTIFLYRASPVPQSARRSHRSQHATSNQPVRDSPSPGRLSPPYGLANVRFDRHVDRRFGRRQPPSDTLHLPRRPLHLASEFDQRLRQR